MQENDAKKLLEKYNAGLATESEIALLDTWYLNWKKTERIDLEEKDYEVAEKVMYSHLPKAPVVKVRMWPRRIAAAAAILLIAGAGLFFYTSRHLEGSAATRDLLAIANNIKPGGNKAILTLSNGSTITLTDAANGALAQQSGVQITKTADGQLIYEALSPSSSNHPASLAPSGRGGEAGEGAVNTISTPKGGQYQVRLPDGSKVWLNAASKLTYPASFNGREERRVELSGEAYFEIAKDKQHPFKVKTTGQEVQVLGTHFNINSYADEGSTKTTLLEGSVKVTALSLRPASLSLPGRGGKAGEGRRNTSLPTGISPQSGERGLGTVLKPGEQALLKNDKIAVSEADLTEAIAWKNGDFIFKNEPLQSVMRKVARWYDVEIIYSKDAPTDVVLTGFVSRSLNISGILDLIQRTKRVQLKIEGKTITILPFKE